LTTLAQEYSNEDKARLLLESWRWPNGPVCPHCKNDGKEKPISKLEAQKESKRGVRKGVHFCGACRKQFTVTVGTIFESSHLPISKWLMAIFLMSLSKSVSVQQLRRIFGISYKTAWFMAHRIRQVMGPDMPLGKLLTGTIEVELTEEMAAQLLPIWVHSSSGCQKVLAEFCTKSRIDTHHVIPD
jgi:transposase-like protein